jgi:rhamnogalacturonan endolyase
MRVRRFHRAPLFLALSAFLACLVASCAGEVSTGSPGAAGSSAGGMTATGGVGPMGSAGTTGSAGTADSGGTTGTGGSPATGTAGTVGTSGGGGSGGSGGTMGSAGASGRGGSAGAAGRGGTTGTAGTSGGGTTGTAGATGAGNNTGGNGFYHMERLNRGLVAVTVSGGVYVGWRMFGFEYDSANPSNVSYNVYRNGTMVANVTNSSNYLDSGGSASSMYTVRAVIGGVMGADSETASVWAQQYLRIPLMVPPGGTTPGSPTCETANEAYTYSANDASVGDVDGDGVYEIILKWDPSNAKDNSQSGCTGNVYIDAYKLNGTRLWRIDLGPNIRAGAHYTQFVVIDADGDGKAEMAVKTAPGTKDGTGAFLKMGPAANDDDSALYRSMNNASGRTGYVLTGPEYLTVFNGQTGAEMATVDFPVLRGSVNSWGDDYGNRVDRFLATAAYVDTTGLPSFIMARGYYTRTTLAAMNWRNGQLTKLWQFDSNSTPRDSANHNYTGQGSHSMTVANVDDDPSQELMYGAMAVDNTGAGLCSTGYNHGDAEHVGDLIPSRPGLEMFMCNEDGAHPAYHIRDARTCAIIQEGPINGNDTGRCVADDISASNPGAEMWASGVSGVFSATTNANLGSTPSSQNFLIYWDADETRELEDGTSISKYGGSTLLSASGCASNNGTKSTPALTADLFGDWREEIIWRESNSSALRLYTTTAVTMRRIYTLMHDAQYRVQVSAEQTAYNQPPHPGFHIGNGMAAPPNPNIQVR